jgi:hypothetical protein
MAMGSWGALAGLDRPFIGLRPFEYKDRDYFFGRDDELDALEVHVRQNSFVCVVGRLGCGKSSLISAGLRPRLEKLADHHWHWLEMRPGEAPVRRLAEALAGLAGETGDLLDAYADRFELVLSKSSFGIGEALASIPALRASKGERTVLFVDQFEELFRFANFGSKASLDRATAAERLDEATRFVRLLLTAIKQPQPRIHGIVAMRSDVIGDCARFHDLPQAVSRSQFLVPDMTRDQREDVIRKPIQVAGGQIDSWLVQRALNDTNDDPDQLPNLQHLMMKCWDRALHRGEQNESRRPHLTIDDYTTLAS